MHGIVVEKRWLTPGLVRLTLGGGDLHGLVMPDATDAYVNIAIPPDGAPYRAVFDPTRVRAEHPQSAWPARRRYTVRAWDPVERLLSLDFVVHGDDGVAGPWAAAAEPGSILVFEGPAGGYRPDPAADWHLLVGDESALPAIAAALEAIPEGAPAVVRLLCDSPGHQVELDSPGRLDLAWLHRTDAPDAANLLPAAIHDLTFPAGRVHAFVHGEATEIRQIRGHLLNDRGLARTEMSCSPYWRRHMADEAWRTVKRDFLAAMDAEVA